MADNERMDTRSPKARKFLGKIPVSIEIYNAITIIAFLIILIAGVVLLPFPYSDGETIFQHLINSITD